MLSGEPKLNFSGPAGGSRTTRVHSPPDTNIHMTRRAFLSLRVLTIYNTTPGEILSSDGPFFSLQISLFDLITRCSRFYHKFQGLFLTILKFISWSTKFTSRSPIFFGRSRGRFTLKHASTCRTSAVVLTKKTPQNLLLFINRVTRACLVPRPMLFSLKQKVLVAPAPLTILIKPIVRLRCRCSCEMCRTSVVPLLVILETDLKSS